MNGHSLYLRCWGKGSPTDVFDSGAGNNSSEWEKIGNSVASKARVCVYDRAGLGQSQRSAVAPTAQQRAQELHSLLRSGNITGPVLLVGHSAGGIIALAYAAQHRENIAGLVMIDAAPRAALGQLRETLRTDQWNAFARLIAEPTEGWSADGLLESERQLQNLSLKFDFPMIVLARGLALQAPPESRWPQELGNPWPAIERAWQEGQRDLARLSSQGELIIASKSRHYIHRTEPELVIQAIDRLLQTFQSRRIAPAEVAW